MGQAERASVESRVAVGHLQDTVSISNEGWGRNNKRFILFISCNISRQVGEGRLREGRQRFRV